MSQRKPGVLLALEIQILETGLLIQATEGNFYGFAVARAMSGRDGGALVAHGTLYKALSRMSLSGLLVAEWEEPALAEGSGRRGVGCTKSRGRRTRAQRRKENRNRHASDWPGHWIGGMGMSVMRAGSYRRAALWVLRWCSWYTRGIEPAIADCRRDELASDLYEQATAADHGDASPRLLTFSILSRALRGVISDLHWRRGELRNNPSCAGIAGRSQTWHTIPVAFVLALATAVALWGAYVLGRTIIAIMRGDIELGSVTFLTLIAITLTSGCGVALLVRARTRWVGAIWMLLPCATVLPLGLFQLNSISTTAGVMHNNMPGFQTATIGLSAGLTLIFAAAVVSFWPAATRRTAPELPVLILEER